MKTEKMTYFTKGLALILSAALIFSVLSMPRVVAYADNTMESLVFITLKQPDPEVPHVVGKTYAEAQTILGTSGFGCEVISGSEDSTTIVRIQDPEAGTLAPANTVVHLTTDPEVPNVVGMTVDAAKQALAKAGLAWNITGSTDSDAIVLAQNPESGIVERGSTIALATEKQVEDPVVPNVVGKTLSEAVKVLEQAGFTYLITGSEDPRALVISQDPKVGERVPQGTTITLTTVKSGGGSSGDGGGSVGGSGKAITHKTADLTYNLFTIMLIVIGAYFALSYSRQMKD